ncbi:phage holin family protein [Sinosporangium siamense]|uniref:Phage holin family protein n=1 Tax=Sinosporangium siamense TaxID=1367973 RepID=A0A919RFL4_9ACTN|nr:phage holin family protein [Sinosporangium siamense]GII92738.1 hypothetical protein Ssi02_29690 [Sinosporangium siamense]
MIRFVVKTLIVAAALWVATQLVTGITVGGSTTAKGIGTLIVVALIFGLVNAVIKPIVQVVGCAFYVLTLGLFAFIVNAGLLLLTSWIAEQINVPFHVDGFIPALFGAIIIAVVSWILDLIIPG